MTKDEISKLAHGDLDVTRALARTIRPAQEVKGIISRQCLKSTEIPDFISPGSISGPTRHGPLNPPRSATAPNPSYGPVESAPVSLPIHDPFPSGIELTGDYGAVRDQLDEYARVCAEHFASAMFQQYPGVPSLWNMPAPRQGEAPARWGLAEGEVRTVEEKLKAALRRIAHDDVRPSAVRKAALQTAHELDIPDRRFRTALKTHIAAAALREAIRGSGAAEIKVRREALTAIVSDSAVPRGVRLQAQAELDGLAA